MYVIRQARPDDASILLKLARMVHFINLPADPEIIADKIRRSIASFEGSMTDLTRAVYMFAMEDDTTGNLLGTSQIIPQIGTPDAPNTYFEVRSRTMYADDLQQGMTHTTLKLGSITDGPTEVGGLILAPSYRGHPARLGKTLSLIRFHYIGLHRERFRDELLAEMMARLTPEGTNAFWEHLGRRFINLTYTEADRLSTRSKAFILKLMPHEEIYVTILPPEARMLIGKVGKDTEPAKAMLERMGFEYRDHIDPFDGGPHLHARTDSVTIVRDTRRLKLGEPCTRTQAQGEALVSFEGEEGFRAVSTGVRLSRDGKTLHLPREEMKAIRARPGDRVGFTLLSKGASGRSKRAGQRR